MCLHPLPVQRELYLQVNLCNELLSFTRNSMHHAIACLLSRKG